MITTPAWALPYRDDRYIAIGLHYAVAMLWQPTCWSLGDRLQRWIKQDEHVLALFDLADLLGDPPLAAATVLNDVMLMRHFDARQQLHTVALQLHHKPELIYVDDVQRCALPDDLAIWPHIAPSCVRNQFGIVPIVDPSLLFCLSATEINAQALQ